MSTILQLSTPIPVIVTSPTLPKGVQTNNRGGNCIAWWVDNFDHQWLVCFDETGEFVWVPMHEIKMAPSWSDGRRYNK